MMFSIEQLKNEYSVYQKTDISDNFKEFEENYAIDVLSKLKKDELAQRIFGDANTSPHGLFSWIEYGRKPTPCKCGAEVGGQLGVQYKPREDSKYVFYEYVAGSRSPNKNSISHDAAISWAEDILKALELCCKIIETAEIETKENYEEMYTRICQGLKEINRPDTKNWYWSKDGAPGYFMLKYFLCSFPQKFAATYSDNSLKQVLTQLLPNDEISDIPFIMNGQLSIIKHRINADCVNFENFIAEKGFYTKIEEKRIWKISHGNLTEAENQEALEKQVILVGWGDDNKQGRDFSQKMKIGDWFYLTLGGGSGIKLLGRIVSDVKNSQIKEEWRERKYQLVRVALNSTPYPANYKEKWEPTGQSTCFEIKTEKLELFETRILKPYFDMHLSDLAESQIDVREDGNYMNVNISDINLNTILYGPPGTGKTYNTVLYAVAICDPKKSLKELEEQAKEDGGYEEILNTYNALLKQGRIAFTTFHQSYGYEDFIEGIKPNTSDTNTVFYKTEPGVFKRFCETSFESLWDQFISSAKANNNQITISRSNGNRVLAWDEDHNKFYDTSTESLSYQYADFNSVKKAFDGNYEKNEKSGSGMQKYYNSVAIAEILKENMKAPKVFIIDEINRGNVSKIFGELITLIEEEKRGKSKAKLPYSQSEFTVPENVYILGTMNTADRSLALMDTALRRRFDFVEMMPDAELFKDVEVEGIKIKDLLETINKRIEFLYDREHTIGHAYFKELLQEESRNVDTLRKIFIKKIIPLLQEYFYDDYERIRLVLGDNREDINGEYFIQECGDVNKLFFGNADIDQESKTYSVNKYIKDFSAERFKKIYE